MRRMFLVPLLIVIAVAAIGGAIGYYIYNNYMFYTTDDAQVSGQIVNINAPTAGVLSTLSVNIGDTVTSGQTIATITSAQPTVPPINIASPINGTILQLYAVQGQTAAPGIPILALTNLSSVTVTAYVDESAISNISKGQSVDITIDAFSGTSFTGHVDQIVQSAASEFSLLPTTDNTSGNFTKVGQRVPVIITLDGTAGKDIVPGLNAEVTIHLH